MYKVNVNICNELEEQTYETTLENGLKVYICKKPGFMRKIGMFGTKYGSINNEFLDILTNNRIKVPDGIAHFLEHKLFEQEGANALDLFSKLGVSANAYTSYDQTVFYFETIVKFKESIKLLVKLVKTPYFTNENVYKEQGIIAQEIMMYDDDPSAMVYVNTLKAMYNINPVNIDIAGTVESIANITKELLYTCYNTFYSPQNMFFIVIGDVDVNETINEIEENIKIYESNYGKSSKKEIQKYYEIEDKNINKSEIEIKMDIYMPQICIGYKLNVVDGKNNIKRQHLASIISDMYFSKSTDFFEIEYKKGILTDPIDFEYEGSNTFSHTVLVANSTKIVELKNDIFSYINKIKNEQIDDELFNLIKKKKIGNLILSADNLNNSYRRIIESTLDNVEIYDDIKILDEINSSDIKEFFKLL
ncbi:MAG: pitrilysin family protein, partial [Clostridia bacterium]